MHASVRVLRGLHMIFTRTVTVDGVTAELDVIVDETALAAYLAPRAMGNKSERTTMSKYVPGESFGGKRTSLVIAQVRKASKRPGSEGPTELKR